MNVVVTGIGVVAPTGVGVADFWAATLAGRSGIAPLPPAGRAGRISGFDPAEHLPSRLLPQTDRVTRLALVAADLALADAAVDPADLPEYGVGVVTSNATGGFEFTHREVGKLWREGPQRVSAYESFAWFYAANTGQISVRHGTKGPGATLVAEQAGGLDAIGHARRLAGRDAQVVVAGGVESSLDPWAWASHQASGRITTADYLPFDERASGYVPGEGGAILVVETASHAAARGAPHVYGELAGFAATFGSADALRQAAVLALADAGLSTVDVDVVFADAAGSPEPDRAESAVIADLFGPHGLPVTAPKAAVGRLYGGGAPLDVVTALLALRDGLVPPTGPVRRAAPAHRIDLVCGTPRALPMRTALVLARGHGGFNSALVVRDVSKEQG
ncbi:MAG TPA: beta-ketoacyl synthase N-terminal-like domain-containing protein [Pseudonocardiaceae bacterium]|nr:beta-ketoacyl synthase N-terminal-like domain-containing protein [Pseudonocardiaceae bacterium]